MTNNAELINKLRKELNEYAMKIDKLDQFINGDDAPALSFVQRDLLETQRAQMLGLVMTIRARIDNLKGND